jgi:hypothetical protein
MPRVQEIDDSREDATLAEAFQTERERFGDLLNPTKIMAHCPPILVAAKALNSRASFRKDCCRSSIFASPRSTAARSESTSTSSV